MQRTPEPDLMDEPEQARAYAEADFSGPHDAFVAHFRRLFPGFAAGRVLDLGCGPGDVTVRFARALPAVAVTAVDGAPAMLALARERIAREGLGERIAPELRRLPDSSLPAAAFDAVISNSLLHHLDDPAVLWETVKRSAKAGAPVMVMDLLRPMSGQELEALVQRHAADAPPVLRRDFAASLRAAYRPEEIRGQLDAAGLSRFSVEVVSDRHMLVWGRR
jgi:SAM-dependent methyltransferase